MLSPPPAIGRVGRPLLPYVLAHIPDGHRARRSELEPSLVDLVRQAERLGRLSRPHWRTDDPIGGRANCDIGGLGQPDIVEEVESTLQPSTSIGSGTTMTNEHQHPNSESDRRLHQHTVVNQSIRRCGFDSRTAATSGQQHGAGDLGATFHQPRWRRERAPSPRPGERPPEDARRCEGAIHGAAASIGSASRNRRIGLRPPSPTSTAAHRPTPSHCVPTGRIRRAGRSHRERTPTASSR